jgi:transposase
LSAQAIVNKGNIAWRNKFLRFLGEAYWLVDGLMEAGYRVHLANPAAMQQYSGLKYTDDRSDARWLAHLLRLGVLPEGYIYPKAERAVRDLLTQVATY